MRAAAGRADAASSKGQEQQEGAKPLWRGISAAAPCWQGRLQCLAKKRPLLPPWLPLSMRLLQDPPHALVGWSSIRPLLRPKLLCFHAPAWARAPQPWPILTPAPAASPPPLQAAGGRAVASAADITNPTPAPAASPPPLQAAGGRAVAIAADVTNSSLTPAPAASPPPLQAAGGRAVAIAADVTNSTPAPAASPPPLQAAGGRAVAIAADVTTPGAPARIMAEATAAFGPSIHILINNAGYTWCVWVWRGYARLEGDLIGG